MPLTTFLRVPLVIQSRIRPENFSWLEFIPSLYCWHNLVVGPRFWVGLHSDPFCRGCEIYCFCKSIYKIWGSIIYTSIGQIVWESNLSCIFQKPYKRGFFHWANKYLIIFMGCSLGCLSYAVNKIVIRSSKIWRLIDWLFRVNS